MAERSPAGLFDGPKQEAPLHRFEVARQVEARRERRTGRRRARHRRRRDVEGALAEDRRPLRDVRQLAEVPGPAMRCQTLELPLVRRRGRLPDAAPVERREVGGEGTDVRRALPERREADHQHRQSEEELRRQPIGDASASTPGTRSQ